jgi:hypothetical protein
VLVEWSAAAGAGSKRDFGGGFFIAADVKRLITPHNERPELFLLNLDITVTC